MNFKMKIIKNNIRKTKGFFHAIEIFSGSKIFNLSYEIIERIVYKKRIDFVSSLDVYVRTN